MIENLKIENYENLISFLKMVLEFYADPHTYSEDKINKDIGFMAKKGLQQIEDIKEHNTNLSDFLTNADDIKNFTNSNIDENIKNNLNNIIKNIKNENLR
jgi:actin-like ATPase involved in cell morphogenesis